MRSGWGAPPFPPRHVNFRIFRNFRYRIGRFSQSLREYFPTAIGPRKRVSASFRRFPPLRTIVGRARLSCGIEVSDLSALSAAPLAAMDEPAAVRARPTGCGQRSRRACWRVDADEHHADSLSTKVGRHKPQHCSGTSSSRWSSSLPDNSCVPPEGVPVRVPALQASTSVRPSACHASEI